MKVSRRHPISEKELDEVLRDIRGTVGVDLGEVLSGEELVELGHVKDPEVERILIARGRVVAFERKERWLPTLHPLLELGSGAFGHAVVVDMGAVKPIASGADVMVPGIVEVRGGFERGDGVVVLDERNERPLAVGIARFDASEIERRDRGRAVENVHHVGDELWEARF